MKSFPFVIWVFSSIVAGESSFEEGGVNVTNDIHPPTTTMSAIDGVTTDSDFYPEEDYLLLTTELPMTSHTSESTIHMSESTTFAASESTTYAASEFTTYTSESTTYTPESTTFGLPPFYPGYESRDHSECQSSEFGCCPDGVSPAHGFDDLGCCAGTEYGCCSDNYFAASGPYDDGCELTRPQYGLCPDGLSAALDDNFLGCGCRYMEDGCCPDGSTPAKGPDYEGCDCFTFKHGCCPDGVSIAEGLHFEGCKSCNSDLGCCPDGITPKGSLESCEECQNTKYGCCFDGVVPAQGLNFEGCESNPLEDLSFKCSGNSSTGPCNDFAIKWFYDSHWGGCNKFWYGGCQPGTNHFDTEEECKGLCVHPRGSQVCYLTLNDGSCDAAYDEFYFDRAQGSCKPFVYGGCLGNGNRFTSMEACAHMCEPDDMSLPVCSKPMGEGMCSGNFPRWFFDATEGQCKSFSYSGCGGNDNRFLTREECTKTCRKEIMARTRKTLCRSGVERFPRDTSLIDNATFIPGWGYDSLLRRCIPIYRHIEDGLREAFFRYWVECSLMCPSTYPPMISLPKGSEILIERDSMGGSIPVSIRANPPATISWLKNDRLIDVLHDFRYEMGPESGLKLKGKASDFNGGTYSVKADNGIGSPSITEVEVIVFPIYSEVSLVLEKALFPPGSKIVLPCSVKGFPPPEINWYKVGSLEKAQVVEDRERVFIDTFQVSTLLSMSNLTIVNGKGVDGGTYICEATSLDSPTASEGVRISVSHGPGEKCVDRPSYKHCHRVTRHKFCGNKYYGQYCCRSCMEAGFLPAGQA